MATGIQRTVSADAHPDTDLGGTHPGGTGAGERGHPVSVSGLSRRFGDRTVLDGLDLAIPAGQFVALLGASGCGKSTLLRILADLDPGFSGTVQAARRRAIAFQTPRLMPWKRVWRNVTLGLPGRADRERALAALAEVGIEARADVWPKTLSGGEAQRVSLARALVREPDLLLLDEPFSALDALTRITAQQLVGELWQRHRCAILLVTHDVDEALRLADRVLVMRDGRIDLDRDIALDRPRDPGDPGFAALRTDLLARLGVHTVPSARPSPRSSQEES